MARTSTAKTTAKKAPAARPAKAVAKESGKPAPKPALKAAARTAAKAAPSAALKTPARPRLKTVAAKAAKAVVKTAAKAAKTAPAVSGNPRLVRDSFTMPEQEYAVLAHVKKACLKAGVEIKKSELLRIGVALLGQLDAAALQGVLASLPQLKTGRPPRA